MAGSLSRVDEAVHWAPAQANLHWGIGTSAWFRHIYKPACASRQLRATTLYLYRALYTSRQAARPIRRGGSAPGPAEQYH